MPIYDLKRKGIKNLYETENDYQYLIIEGNILSITDGNSVELPSTDLTPITPTISAPTVNIDDEANIDLQSTYSGFFEIDCTGLTDLEILLTNPIAGGVYTIRLFDVTNVNVTWPVNLYDETETLLGLTNHTDGVMVTFYYNGTNYYTKAL